MAKEGEQKGHSEHSHERKLRYYKKTTSLLTLGLEVFFLFFVAAIIFLFVATDDATKFEIENQQLLQKQQTLTQQINQLQSLVLNEQSSSFLTNDSLIRTFTLPDGTVASLSLPLEVVTSQVQQGYQRRDYIQSVALPLHARYAQTCYDFAVYCTDDVNDINDVRSFYEQELTSLESLGLQYQVVSLGSNQETIVDFRDFVVSDGFEDEVAALRVQYPDDEEFIKALWSIVSQVTTYEKELKETPKYPLETLLSSHGDCEDSAILFVSMLNAIDHGWQVSFLYTDLYNLQNPREFNHVLVHIVTSEGEYFVETTSKETMNPYLYVSGEELLI